MNELAIKMAIETTTSCQLVQNFLVCAVETSSFETLLFVQSRHLKLYCLCSRDIQNFIFCAVATFKTLLFVQSRHSKLYCLCSHDIQNFIVCAVATFKTLLFVQWRHSKLYCLCNRDIQNFIVCAVETFKTLLFVQSRHSKLYCLCSRAIRNFLVCVSLLGLRRIELLLLTSNRCNQTPIHSFDLRSKFLRVPRLPYEIRAEISYVNVPTKNIFIVNHSLYLRNYSLTCSSIF